MKGTKSGSGLVEVFSLLMFMGGTVVTLIMLAQAFAFKGTLLAGYFVLSCAGVLGATGAVITRSSGDNAWLGGALGGCLGAFISVVIYFCTRHLNWWQ